MNTAVAGYGRPAYQAREQLFEEHLGLARSIAGHISMRLPPGHSLVDLVQVGMIGLLEAARVYDSSQGASFKSYASIRIRGAIMDELRRQSWMPRSVQKKARQVSQAIRKAEQRLGRAATDREIAGEMRASMAEYNDALEAISGSTVFSLDDEDSSLDVEDAGGLPFEQLHSEALRKKLALVIAGLPGKEKLVMSLYYEKELNLKEVGRVLEVSESRVCQIHSQAIARIRSRMRDWIEAERDEAG